MGRNAAFRMLYEEYWTMVKYFVTRNSGRESEAADIFQETLLVLFEKVREPQFRLSSSLKTYLYSIARNLWLKELRKKGKEAVVDFEDIEEVGSVEMEDSTDERTDLLGRCLKMLGDNCRDLIHRFYYLRHSMQVIANEMGYSNADTAKAQKYKCVQKLRELVKISEEQ